jgi:hypothetical protein
MEKTARSLFLGLILLVGMTTLILTAGAQPDPTAEQATLDAIVQGFFDQTASAAPLLGQTQTLQAAFDSAQTGTAAFNATVQAAFNTAATATQLSIATPTPSPVPNRISSTREIDLVAGMAGRNVYLAPSGERFAHVSVVEICIYTMSGARERCLEIPDRVSSIDLERFRWSLDSRYLTFTEDFIIRLHEPDIWVIDVDTGNLTNITDDQVTRSVIFGDEGANANLDFAPLWMRDGRLAFLRYNRTGDSSTAAVYAAQADGSGLEVIASLPVEVGFPVYSFDISRDGRWLAYNWFTPSDESAERNGLWLTDLETGETRQLFSSPSNEEVPQMVSISPDGRYVLWLDPRYALPPEDAAPEGSPVRVIPVGGGEPKILDPNSWVFAAWWSPEGSAIAYLVRDQENPASGLYIASTPGEAGELVLEGLFLPPQGRISVPVMWAANNSIILSNAPEQEITVTELGN